MSNEGVRPQSPELDLMLGQRFNVLGSGFVRVIDYMGTDNAIVQAARVSYGTGTKKVHQDRGLIRYLLRHGHTSPFEMCELKLHLRVPMDTWRQWVRHRTASINEYSTRYSVAIDQAHTTAADAWRSQARDNKQGSGDLLPASTGEKLTQQEQALHKQAREVYNERLQQGVAREQARKDLPLSTYTEAYWKIDLHNLLHFLQLRKHDHAQEEIRQYATLIGDEIVRRWVPLTWEAFQDYRIGDLSFSRNETLLLQLITAGESEKARQTAKKWGWLPIKEGRMKTSAEARAFANKLEQIGLDCPWV